MPTPWPNPSRLRRLRRAGDRFCAAATPHLEMAIVFLLALLLMHTALR